MGRSLTITIGLVCGLAFAAGQVSQTQSKNSAADGPAFQVDPSWPKPLPNKWILGPVSTVAVDGQQHIWVLHRPKSLKPDEIAAGTPAPPVLEFDTNGNLLQAWGGPGEGYEWPKTAEHTVYVDSKDHVWITGDNQILKFDQTGKFLLQIGHAGKAGGSNDKNLLGRTPAGVAVDPVANEVYIADGYQNRRVVVFDADTGAYKRHWGAYGKPPDDSVDIKYVPNQSPASQFANPVHCVRITRTGLVYVCDRINDRFQIFRKDGTFVKEVLIARETGPFGSVWDLAVSPDERFMYVADGTNQKVWVLSGDKLEIIGSFGQAGKMPGEFVKWVHGVAVDSKGNFYTAEVNEGRRVQKFTYKGTAPTH